MKKILIAVPTFTGQTPIELNDFLDNVIIPEGYTKNIVYSKRTLIDRARNEFTKKAIEGGYDYLFFVDDDTIPNKDVLVNLLSEGLGIVSGLYRGRIGDKKLIVYQKIDGKYHNINKINIALGTIQKIDACGGGCLLINVDVLRDMVDNYGYHIFDTYNGMSEDISFCDLATSMGYNIYLDTRCTCYHIGEPEKVKLDDSFYCVNSEPKLSIIVKESLYSKFQPILLDKIKNNFELTSVKDGEYLDKGMFENSRGEYVMFIDNVEIPYRLDEIMIKGLSEADIVGPMTIINNKLVARNDNIVTYCWMMKKSELLKYLPIPTKIQDFTLYRKIKENRGVCGILPAKIKYNG